MCLDCGEGKAHNRKGNGNIQERGAFFKIPDKVQKQSKRSLSYRGHDIRTCSTVSTVPGQLGHLSVSERCRLKSD